MFWLTRTKILKQIIQKGIGLEILKKLIYKNYKVIMACRNVASALDART